MDAALDCIEKVATAAAAAAAAPHHRQAKNEKEGVEAKAKQLLH